MPIPFSTNHLQSPIQMSPPLGSLPGFLQRSEPYLCLLYIAGSRHYSNPTTVVFISSFRGWLCGEFSESTNILKDNRGHWARGWVLELDTDTLGTNLVLFILLPRLGVILQHFSRLPFSCLDHRTRMGHPLEGGGEGAKRLRTVPNTRKS